MSDNKASIVTNSWGEPTFLVDRRRRSTRRSTRTRGRVRVGVQAGRRAGDRLLLLLGRRRRRPRRRGASSTPTIRPATLGDLGRRDVARHRTKNRAFETGWGTAKFRLALTVSLDAVGPFLYGAGGGFSQVFDRPWYQNGVVPDTQAAAPSRTSRMDADRRPACSSARRRTSRCEPFGPAGIHYGEYRIGGTSLSSRSSRAAGRAQGPEAVGFANPLIYHLASRPTRRSTTSTPQGDAGNVRVPTTPTGSTPTTALFSVRTFDQDSSLKTTRGWDDVTGVGARRRSTSTRSPGAGKAQAR